MEYELTKNKLDSITNKLVSIGYATHVTTTGYERYSQSRGDSVFISHSLNIIRTTKYTDGDRVIKYLVGSPNGKCSPTERDRLNAWFFNGFTGKGLTSL